MTLAVAGTTVVAAPATSASAAVPGTAVAAAAPVVSPVVSPAVAPVAVTRSVQQHTYAYGTDARQTLDAYWATPHSGRQPAVLLLHGGYWLSGDKGSWKTFAKKLSGKGYAVFAANYRLSQQKRWPAQRNDAMSALAYIKQHAVRFHLDPNRVVVIGASAGGQLAAMVGTYGVGRKNVRGVVALSPVNSPYLAYLDGGKPGARASKRKLRSAVVQLIGCTPKPDSIGCWDRVQDVTPINHVDKGDAPMLLMHSAGDFVPYEQSTALRDALVADSIPVTLTKIKGSAHGQTLLNDAQVERTVVAWVYAVTR